MKILMIGLLLGLASCTSSQAKKECELTCLETNCIVDKVLDNGCVCKSKENPEEMVHGVH